jgi:hypothetical protein
MDHRGCGRLVGCLLCLCLGKEESRIIHFVSPDFPVEPQHGSDIVEDVPRSFRGLGYNVSKTATFQFTIELEIGRLNGGQDFLVALIIGRSASCKYAFYLALRIL